MASTSAPRRNTGYGRISSAASTISSDNLTLVAEIRKAMNMMKEIGIDFERENESEMVKELEAGVLDLLKASDECVRLSNAIQIISDEYQPGIELTNFSKLFEDKIEVLKAESSSASQSHAWLRQFREAVWNVHHAGQPMPGEEQEDIIMTSTEFNVLNSRCPITGKPVDELAEPVRSMDCKHIYEKKAIMQYIKSKTSQGNCPISACLKKLQANRVVCDAMLQIDIDEMRSRAKESGRDNVIEDFTHLDDG